MRIPRPRLRTLLLLIAATASLLGYARHRVHRAELIQQQEFRVWALNESYALALTPANRPLSFYERHCEDREEALAEFRKAQATLVRVRPAYFEAVETLERLKASW